MHTQGMHSSLPVMLLALVSCELLQAASTIHPQESVRHQGGEKWKVAQESTSSTAKERTNISFVVKPSAVLQEMFNPRRYNNDSLNRWQGSDVDLSIRLTKDYDLFLYGDSLIGTWNETTGARECTVVFNHGKPEPCRIGVVSKMPHSTFGVWDRVNRTMTWFWGHNYTSLLQPNWAEPKRIFWGISMTPVFEDGDQFCVIGEQILFVADQPMGFEANGTYAVCLSGVKENPADPRTWSQRWSRVEGSGNDISAPTKKRKSSYHHSGHNPVEAVRIQEDRSMSREQTTTTAIDDTWGGGGGGASTRKVSSRESNVTLGSLNWRNAIYATGNQANDYLYIYGALSLPGQFSGQVLARLRFTDLLRFNWTALQMYDPRTKGYTLNVVNDFVPMTPQDHLELLPILKLWWLTIPEFTVQYSNVLAAFFLLYIDFDEYQVKIKTSPRLEGPWTQEGLAIYNLPWPMNASKDVFCYATKAHPDLYDYVAPNPHSASSSSSPDAFFHRQPHGQGVDPRTIVSEVFPFSYVCNGKEVRVLFEAEFADVYLPVFNTLEVSKQI
jgi:hypothetical protein